MSGDMRTNIEIDDELMTGAMAALGLSTKKAAVAEALRLVVAGHQRNQAIEAMHGSGWVGDLDRMREGRDRWSRPDGSDGAQDPVARGAG